MTGRSASLVATTTTCDRAVASAGCGNVMTWPGTLLTTTVTVPVWVPPLPSATVYVKVSVPVKPAAGVYRTPVGENVALPCAGWVTAVMVSGSPSTSVSLARTGTAAPVLLAATVVESGAATGGVFTQMV